MHIQESTTARVCDAAKAGVVEPACAAPSLQAEEDAHCSYIKQYS